MSYKVLFIDEESTQHDDFKDHFEENWSEAVCECLFPARTIEEMIYLLEKKHPVLRQFLSDVYKKNMQLKTGLQSSTTPAAQKRRKELEWEISLLEKALRVIQG